MYVGEPLTGDQISAIANEATPVFDDLHKCTNLSAELTLDTLWENGFGQNCQWLFDNKLEYPGVNHQIPL
jgi:hypothetical protein